MLINTLDGSVVSETDFRRSHKNVSFPPGELPDEILTEYGMATLRILPHPALELNQKAVLADPAFNGVEWVQDWTIENIPVGKADVKGEAGVRILAVAPEWKQRNLISQAVILGSKDKGTWTAAEKSLHENFERVWEKINAIRAASDRIEAMTPIPRDFQDDKYWP